MALDGDKIKVEGLRDFQKALRQVDKEYPKQLRKSHYEIAKFVRDSARSKASSLGSVAAKSAKSLRAGAEQRGAHVVIDGARYPYALGAEFGSIRYKQFKAWRGNQAGSTANLWEDGGAGYFLHPTIRNKREEIIDRYWKHLDDLHLRAFPD